MGENLELRRKLEGLEAKQLQAQARELSARIQEVNGLRFIGQVVEADTADNLKKLAGLTAPVADVVVLAANISQKASVVVAVADAVVTARGIEANTLIKQYIAPLIKGGGGGQKNLATAGGQEVGHLPQVVQAVSQVLAAG
ncbi:MAG TPA: DHHA1 domain-containing protein [Phnomibacter sp.]|nr:DHHA1 domain-containing protein [Phnomibacter sp.]